MGLIADWKNRRFKKRMLESGTSVMGRVIEINENFYYPWELAQMRKKTGKPMPPPDPHCYIAIAYPDAQGAEQILHLLVRDKTQFAPVGREVPVRYLAENGTYLAVPEETPWKENT